jgi:hypothetical protein
VAHALRRRDLHGVVGGGLVGGEDTHALVGASIIGRRASTLVEVLFVMPLTGFCGVA